MRDPAAYVWMEHLLYASGFTQRSPILPDAWIRYGVEGSEPQDLLLMANWSESGTALAAELKRRVSFGLPREEAAKVLIAAQIAPTQSAAAAKLTFAQLMRDALPMSPWWHRYLLRQGEPAALFASRSAFAPLRAALVAGMRGEAPPPWSPRITRDFVWLARVAGALARVHDKAPGRLEDADENVLDEHDRALLDHDATVEAFFLLFAGVCAPNATEPLWSVHRNRPASAAIRESTATVKADAARTVFDVSGRGIRWAVIDSGIDARHIAFRQRDAEGTVYPDPFVLPDGVPKQARPPSGRLTRREPPDRPRCGDARRRRSRRRHRRHGARYQGRQAIRDQAALAQHVR